VRDLLQKCDERIRSLRHDALGPAGNEDPVPRETLRQKIFLLHVSSSLPQLEWPRAIGPYIESLNRNSGGP